MVGSTISHYRITGKLGAGGMGEVYRATDSKLDRDVAIKVMPEEFAENAERVARFEREAKALAKLNHPNIASIYGFDQHEGKWFLVLELIEGETLSERLRTGPMPVDEALKVFKQIAEALEAAHEKHIVHRDLKPANVKIDPQGRVKVLDFGLAKARFSARSSTDSKAPTADSDGPTITSEFTVPGKVMGTAAYMSPEQSRGQDVDRRTDVWAFGCCLYEALTGKKPFKGQTSSDLLAAILKTDPDFTVVPPETPSEVLTLLRRCLEKDPQRRMRYLGDIALTLEDVTETSRLHTVVRETASSSNLSSSKDARGLLWWKLATLAAIAAAVVMAIVLIQQKNPPSQIRSVAVLPFQNLKDTDRESEFLATTLQFALKKQLRNLRDLDIKTKDSPDVGAVVQGTFVQMANSYHVTVEITDKASGSIMLAESYDGSVTNIFPLQNEIATAVAERVRSNLTDQERRQIAAERNIDPQAYIAYRQGLHYYDLGSVDGLAKAEKEFEKARQLDNQFIEPVVGLANIEWRAVVDGSTLVQPKEAFPKAKKYLEEAKALDETHSEVMILEGWIALMWDWDWLTAREAFRKAIDADAQNGECYSGWAWYLAIVQGRYAESLRAIERAIELDPERLGHQMSEGDINRWNGNSAKGFARITEISRENPTSWQALWAAALFLLDLGELNEAREKAKAAVDLSDRDPRALNALARIEVTSGDRKSAETILAELKETASITYVPAIEVALVQAALEDWDSAFVSLQTAYDEKQDGSFIYAIRTPNVMALFANQPRFWELTDRLGFPGLPLEHPLYDLEQELRYGRDSPTASVP